MSQYRNNDDDRPDDCDGSQHQCQDRRRPPHENEAQGVDGQSLLSDENSRRQKDLYRKEQNNADGSVNSDWEDDDGYETDHTSSYDSDQYPENVFIQVRHGGTPPHQPLVVPGLYDTVRGTMNSQKRRKLNSGRASDEAGEESEEESLTSGSKARKDHGQRGRFFHTKHVRCVPASEFASSPFFTVVDSGASAGNALDESPEAIQELCNLTRHSYNVPSEVGSSSSSRRLSPLLETHLKAVQQTAKAQELLERARSKEIQKLPRPPVAAAFPRQPLGVVASSVSSPASVITFRKVLEPSQTARLVTLSFAPFIVVHVNGAFTSLTGYLSSEILGRPLKYCLSKEHQEKFSSSVTSMQDRLASVMCKYQERCRCSVKVSLVGPEPEQNAPQEKDGEAVDDGNEKSAGQEDDTCLYVTHYGIDLNPVDATGDMEDRGVVSPDSSACGILG